MKIRSKGEEDAAWGSKRGVSWQITTGVMSINKE